VALKRENKLPIDAALYTKTKQQYTYPKCADEKPPFKN